MLRSAPKLLLVATAFAPVMMTTAIVSWWRGDSKGAGYLFSGVLIAVVLCLMVLRSAASKLSRNRVVIKAIKPADKEIVGFVLAYLLPLAKTSGSHYDSFPLYVIIAVFFFVVMTSNAYHTNPLLGFLGFHFYEVTIEEVGYVLISRRNLHNTRAIKEVVSLTDYMLMDISK